MTEIKPGDTAVSSGYTLKVLAVHEESGLFWGLGRGGKPLTYSIASFTKVEPFFEAGKTYRYGSQRFEVEKTGEDSYGHIAFGVLQTGHSTWHFQRSFGGWEEVDVS